MKKHEQLCDKRAEASKGLIRASSAPSLKAAAACNFRRTSWHGGEVT